MMTAEEFYTKRNNQLSYERKALEERIMKAADDDSELNVLGHIFSPFKEGYQIAKVTEEWLREFGWKFVDDMIQPIDQTLTKKIAEDKPVLVEQKETANDDFNPDESTETVNNQLPAEDEPVLVEQMEIANDDFNPDESTETVNNQLPAEDEPVSIETMEKDAYSSAYNSAESINPMYAQPVRQLDDPFPGTEAYPPQKSSKDDFDFL